MTRFVRSLSLLVGALLASPVTAQDDHGDTCASATPVAFDRPVGVTIGAAGDVDFLAIPARAGFHYVAKMEGGSLGFGANLTILAADCVTPGPTPVDVYAPR